MRVGQRWSPPPRRSTRRRSAWHRVAPRRPPPWPGAAWCAARSRASSGSPWKETTSRAGASSRAAVAPVRARRSAGRRATPIRRSGCRYGSDADLAVQAGTRPVGERPPAPCRAWNPPGGTRSARLPDCIPQGPQPAGSALARLHLREARRPRRRCPTRATARARSASRPSRPSSGVLAQPASASRPASSRTRPRLLQRRLSSTEEA